MYKKSFWFGNFEIFIENIATQKKQLADLYKKKSILCFDLRSLQKVVRCVCKWFFANLYRNLHLLHLMSIPRRNSALRNSSACDAVSLSTRLSSFATIDWMQLPCYGRNSCCSFFMNSCIWRRTKRVFRRLASKSRNSASFESCRKFSDFSSRILSSSEMVAVELFSS